jgi:hypothetical protein
MISRTIIAAALAAGTAGAALADVKVNTPGAKIDAPSGPVELNIDVGSQMKPTEAWVGRAVYSSDGKNIGEVAAIAEDSIYVDMGGFLGIGESRVLVSGRDLGSVAPDRIVLKMTETEAKTLPSTDAKPTPAPAR